LRKAYANGYRYVILEAPVGSGKSAIAITFARLFGNSHIITPKKSLQNQYFADFNQHVVLMKGRASYPCTYQFGSSAYDQVIEKIKTGSIRAPSKLEVNCGNAPCLDDKQLFRDCTAERDCPYHVAIQTADTSNHIIHNLHSFIFQMAFAARFKLRRIMIIDEAHEIESMVRDFISKRITLPKALAETDLPNGFKTVDEWCDWFSQEQFVKLFPDVIVGKSKETEREKFLDRLKVLESYREDYGEKFVVAKDIDVITRRSRFTFIPESIGSSAHNLLFQWGEKILLMSGTIYNKNIFCKNLNIKPEEAYFLRLDSSFPVPSRPIYLKRDYMVDTSHAKWHENFPKLVEIIKTVLDKFPDVKGLIHTPSYSISHQIYHGVKDKRLTTHGSEDFLTRLEKFFEEKDNKVFISPTCQQGVDFKDERARFQIIIRVPYLNTNDPFIERKVKTDFPWYNYQTLVLFGQQIGRINRSEQDFGITVLIDERFEKFIGRNKKTIPGWVHSAVIRD
jgi:ATP-dependent DNA helicase DinG